MNKPIVETYNEAVELQKEHLHFNDPVEQDLVMVWNLHTWMYKDFGVTPYLKLCGVKQSGKTAIMEFCQLLVQDGAFVTDLNKAGIFRLIKKGANVLFFDEFENMCKYDDKGMEGILNGGYKKSGAVVRCTGESFEAEEYDIFCPKVFATVKDIKSDTLNDRCIEVITSKAQAKLKQVGTMLDSDKAKVTQLRTEFEQWLQENKDKIVENFHTMEDLHGRDYELLAPLLSIARELGKEAEIREYYQTQKREKEEYLLEKDWQYKLLRTLQETTTAERQPYPVKVIAQKFRTNTGFSFVSDAKIGKELRKLGLKPLPRTNQGYAYLLGKADVEAAIKRNGYSDYILGGSTQSTLSPPV